MRCVVLRVHLSRLSVLLPLRPGVRCLFGTSLALPWCTVFKTPRIAAVSLTDGARREPRAVGAAEMSSGEMAD